VLYISLGWDWCSTTSFHAPYIPFSIFHCERGAHKFPPALLGLNCHFDTSISSPNRHLARRFTCRMDSWEPLSALLCSVLVLVYCILHSLPPALIQHFSSSIGAAKTKFGHCVFNSALLQLHFCTPLFHLALPIRFSSGPG
jgi:hypothetical protein